MKFNFGQEVLVLPASVLSAGNATAEQLRALLWLASDPSLAEKPRQLAKLAECDLKTANASLAYWSACGVLSPDGARVAASAEGSAGGRRATRDLVKRADELPSYTTVEITQLLEKRETVRALINESQQILGKIFNTSELNIMVGMLDYLGMSEESVLILLAHCKQNGRTNLRAIEKYAYTLVDKGITEPGALEEEFRVQDALRSFEGEVRTLFGMKDRALTTKESRHLRAWAEFGYSIEIVRLAYDLTIQATHEPSVDYTNGILERWHAEGLGSVEQIHTYLESRRKQRTQLGNSFDTDDFFEAALQRSFRETGADS